MKSLSGFIIAIFVFGVFVSFPCIASAQKVISLKYAVFFPGAHQHAALAEQWSSEIEKRTNGKVKITVFPGGTLTPAAQTYEDVVRGIADIGMSVFAYTRGRFPLMEVVDLPLGYKNGIAATRLANEYYKRFKPRELDEVKVMYLHAHGPGLLHTKKPVNKLEDLKGMKIRATGLAAKIVSVLGAVPVAVTMPDAYDALRTGVVDGSMATNEALKGWKWGEVIRYTTYNYSSAYTTAMFVVMNKAKWNSLPPDVQKVFDEVSEEWIDKQGATWDRIDKESIEFAKLKGVTFRNLRKEEDARWAEKVKPLLNNYVTGAKAKGLPGDEALKFCLHYLKSSSMPLESPEGLAASKERSVHQSADQQPEQNSVSSSETLVGRSRPLFESTDTSPPQTKKVDEAAIKGVWTGTVRQGSQTYPVRMTIFGTVAGNRAGKIDYPTLKCGGNLTLLKADPRRYVVYEEMEYGNNRCVDRGTIELSLQDNNMLSWEWRYPNGRSGAQAVLHKGF